MAKLLKFPSRNNPTDDDIAILMRAAIKISYEKVRANGKQRSGKI
jgi:hypothetical protein